MTTCALQCVCFCLFVCIWMTWCVTVCFFFFFRCVFVFWKHWKGTDLVFFPPRLLWGMDYEFMYSLCVCVFIWFIMGDITKVCCRPPVLITRCPVLLYSSFVESLKFRWSCAGQEVAYEVCASPVGIAGKQLLQNVVLTFTILIFSVCRPTELSVCVLRIKTE